MYGIRDVYIATVSCICTIDPSCRNAMAIYNTELNDYLDNSVRVNYIVPGFSAGCFPLKSLRFSTLMFLNPNALHSRNIHF